MSSRDLYHKLVKEALVAEGWTVTDDPLRIRWEEQDFQIDLGAERVLLAEKENQKIAVEIKSFLSASLITDFYNAIGQFSVYQKTLAEIQPERVLYLAMPLSAYDYLFQIRPVGRLFLRDQSLRVIVFDPETEEIIQWIT